MHNLPIFQFRHLVHFFLLCLVCLGIAEAKPTKQEAALISDWRVVRSEALDNNLPIVLLVEISDCRFCKIVKKEFINPLAASQHYKDKVIFRRISLDPGQMIIDGDGFNADTDDFCAHYKALFTPTILFLDGAGKELTKTLVGMSGRDYFGYYLEQRIDESIKALQFTEQ